MKLTMVFLLAACLHVSATGFGQKVSISGKDLPLEKVFSIIKKQTSYVFFYDYGIFQGARTVSLDLKDAEVEDVLRACLQGQGLDFSITNKTISIVRKVEKKIESTGPGPEKTIKAEGVVMTESGQPLAGANITEKKSGKGTITNAKGEFQLSEVPINSTLVISFIGYTPQQVMIKDAGKVQVYLNVAKNELDKVVIQAYGTTTERLNTGNIATVSSAEIERQPVMNALEVLEGKVPGLIVTQSNGYASAPFRIEIRGRNTINPNLIAEPLYIVDGVPLTILNLSGSNYAGGSQGIIQNGFGGPAGGQSPFFSINPSDIESITVLKDGDATAIYGSRGADGVIIINTKKGKPGKSKLEISAYNGISEVTGHYKMLNTTQYIKMRREALNNDNLIPNSGNAYDLVIWDTTRYTDWQKVLWGGRGRTTDAEANLSGGDKSSTYRIAGSYHRQTSILSYNGADQRASLQFNFSHKSLDQRFNFSLTSQYSFTQSDLINLPGIVTLPPDAPSIFDTEGHLNWKGWIPNTNQLSSFGSLFQPYLAKTGYLNNSLILGYQILKGLTISTNLGYSTTHNSQRQTFPIISLNPENNPTGSSSFGDNNVTNYIIEPQINFKTSISKSKIEILFGGTTQAVSQDGESIQATGYTNDNLLRSVSSAPSNFASDVSGQYKYAGIFGRINFNWNNKYVLNLSGRRDGSSKFGPGKQYGNFGALGLAYLFTEENWFRNHLAFLSFGKMRASYGLTGSDAIGDYQYLTQWSSSGIVPYQGVASYVPLIHANPNLQWQVDKKLEVAVNLGFLKDKVLVELSWYRNRCGNQLLQYVLPIITGFPSVTANFPATLQNMGWESSIGVKIIDKKMIQWRVNINMGANQNKLIAFPNIDQTPYAAIYTVGQSLNIRKMLHYTGVNPQNGQYTFQDKNHDGIISVNPGLSDDRYGKDLSIKIDGGISSDFMYKNIELNAYLNFRTQNKPAGIYNGFPGQSTNQSIQVLNHWQKQGDIAPFGKYSTLSTSSNYNFFYNSDGVYSNASFIRLKNLSISYNVNSKSFKKLVDKSIKIFFRAENLFVITKYNGVDPDSPGLGLLPPAKVFTAGFQFSL